MFTCLKHAALGVMILALGACASYDQKHVDYQALETFKNSTTLEDITLSAEAYDTEVEVTGAFDENLNKKGYYPVQVLLENSTQEKVVVLRESVELLAPNGEHYRPVGAAVMADEFEDNAMAYALFGFGILSYMSAQDANQQRSVDYQHKDLGESTIIAAGRKRGAFIYFKLPEGTVPSGATLMLEVEKLSSQEMVSFELLL